MKQLKKFNEDWPVSGASANTGFRDPVKKSREGHREHRQRALNSSEECLRYFVVCEEFQIEIASQDPDVHRLHLGSAMPRGGPGLEREIAKRKVEVQRLRRLGLSRTTPIPKGNRFIAHMN